MVFVKTLIYLSLERPLVGTKSFLLPIIVNKETSISALIEETVEGGLEILYAGCAV